MAGEWPQQALEDVAELSGGFAFKSEDYSREGRFVLRTLNIKDDGSVRRDDAVFIPLDKCDLYKRFELQEHDTLFVMVGATLGKVGYVRREALPALLNQNMWRIRGRDGLCDKRYLQYAFRHTVVKSLSWASGSARDFVRRDDYRTMQIPVPPLAEQKAIAAVLGALDDKIELNRRMNATLEAAARALFQSWFVDFDLVRAKLGGRKPADLDAAMADHFPGSFEHLNGELIPAGWKIAPLTDVYEIRSGLSKPRSEFGFGHGFLTFMDVLNNTFVPHTLTALVNSTDKERELCSVKRGDVFLTRTSETQEDLGMSCVALDDHPEATFNGFTKRLRPKAASYPSPEYAGYYFRSAKFRRDVTAMSSLSTRASLNNQMLSKLTIVLPPKSIGDRYGFQVSSMVKQIQSNHGQSETLAALRDALLPKLLSGELRVSEPEARRGKAI